MSSTSGKPVDSAAVAELLAQDRHKLLLRHPFTGAVVMRLDTYVDRVEGVETAATNGHAIWVNPDFYATLDLDERLFVIAHEVWHCILLHFSRRVNRDQMLFNIATDLEIHFLLTKEGFNPPFVLPHDESWDGLSAEEIYERLLCQQPQGGPRSRTGRLVETGHIRSRNGEGFDQHDVPALPEATDAEEHIRQAVISAAQTVERDRGALPCHLEALVKALLRPSFNWKTILARFVTSCYGGGRRWLPPSRRQVYRGLYLPSMRQERLRAVVAIDTSGSTEGDLPAFFSELVGLLQSFGDYALTVLQCDSGIQSVQTFTADDEASPSEIEWKARGFGGTSFVPVFNYVEEHPELDPSLLVYCTDGYGDAPKKAPPYPVLWVLTKDGMPPASWGSVAYFAPRDDEFSLRNNG